MKNKADMEKLIQKIQNLLMLASNNPSEEEAKAAMLKAQELMLKYHIDNPGMEEDEAVKCIAFWAGPCITEFQLMVSVVVANNFRSKTTSGCQRIFFIGFEEDIRAAISVYEYTLNYKKTAFRRFFAGRRLSFEDIKNWEYGFVMGLYTAYNSRKGYELMVKVPGKVQDYFDSLKTKSIAEKYRNGKVTKLEGAFTDGFRRGRDSVSEREIGTCGIA